MAFPLMIFVAGPYRSIVHSAAERVLARCDACLRIGGPSEGVDRMVDVARALRTTVYIDFAGVP